MSHQSGEDLDKIIVLGLAESGKTTIIKVVGEGYVPDKKAPYTATLDYNRNVIKLFGKNLTVFDLGGQKAFLDRFVGELAQFVFSNVKIMIFIVDIVKVDQLSLAKYYFDLAMNRLKRYSQNSSVFVFFHKIDLIDPTKTSNFCNKIKTYISRNVDYPLTFFETSVFSESIFNAFKEITVKVTDKLESLETIIDDFIKENSGIVNMIQLFSEDGKPLLDTSTFTHVSTDEVRESFNSILEHISTGKEKTTSVFLESKDDIYFIQFFDNNNVLILSFSRAGITAKKMTIPMIHSKVNLLLQKLNF
ncbi:MAG: ADP-ribosylation factor-like protein [Promethearchaeota archaeon]